MKSYKNAHAMLAAEGVNILNMVPLPSGNVAVLFEYSWHDPKQEGKLHWSKTTITIGANSGRLDLEVIDRVRSARKELECGE